MKRLLLISLLLLAPLPARAQVDGLRLEGGLVFLTKAGELEVSKTAIEADAGYALRGKLRYSFGPVSLTAEAQFSAQSYGTPQTPGAPENLNAGFLGVTGAAHPFKVFGLVPYVELGIGQLYFSDDRVSTEGSSVASLYGIGVILGGEGKVAVDVGLRLLRMTDIKVEGVTDSFQYEPKQFSVMISIRL